MFGDLARQNLQAVFLGKWSTEQEHGEQNVFPTANVVHAVCMIINQYFFRRWS